MIAPWSVLKLFNLFKSAHQLQLLYSHMITTIETLTVICNNKNLLLSL